MLTSYAAAYLSYAHNMLVIGSVIVICDFCSEPEESPPLHVTQHSARLFMHNFLKP